MGRLMLVWGTKSQGWQRAVLLRVAGAPRGIRQRGHSEPTGSGGRLPAEHLDDVREGRQISKDLSHHLENALVSAGERVIRVSPTLMGASRCGEREPGKSDQIDARAIARAVLREGAERFPSAFQERRPLRTDGRRRADPGLFRTT